MCIGYDPLAPALPYFISGLIFLVATMGLIIFSYVKKIKSTTIQVSKIILITISIILIAIFELMLNITAKGC